MNQDKKWLLFRRVLQQETFTEACAQTDISYEVAWSYMKQDAHPDITKRIWWPEAKRRSAQRERLAELAYQLELRLQLLLDALHPELAIPELFDDVPALVDDISGSSKGPTRSHSYSSRAVQKRQVVQSPQQDRKPQAERQKRITPRKKQKSVFANRRKIMRKAVLQTEDKPAPQQSAEELKEEIAHNVPTKNASAQSSRAALVRARKAVFKTRKKHRKPSSPASVMSQPLSEASVGIQQHVPAEQASTIRSKKSVGSRSIKQSVVNSQPSNRVVAHLTEQQSPQPVPVQKPNKIWLAKVDGQELPVVAFAASFAEAAKIFAREVPATANIDMKCVPLL